MAKDLRLDVVTSSDDKGLVESAIAMNKLANEADKVGNQFKETAVDGGILAAELDRVKRKQLELAAAFDATGQKSLLKQISGNQRYEAQLKRVEKELGTGLTKSLDEANASGEGFVATLTQMGAAASPFLVPVAAGSLLAVLGAGGLALGIAGSLNSPLVKNALASFKADAAATLHGVSAGYDKELAGSLHILDEGVTGFLTNAKGGLQAIRPELTVIATDLKQALQQSGQYLGDALSRDKPVLDALGSSLKTLIVDTSKAFDNMSYGAKGAGQAVRDLTNEVGTLIVALGNALGDVSKVYGTVEDALHSTDKAVAGSGGLWTDIWTGVKDQVQNALNPIHGAEYAVNGLNEQLHGAKPAAEQAAVAQNDLWGYVSRVRDAVVAQNLALEKNIADLNAAADAGYALGDANLAMHQAMSGFQQALKDNKHNWDLNTTAGQNLYGAFQANAEGIQTYYEKLEAGKPADAGLLTRQLKAEQALYKTADAAGATTDELKPLADSIAALQKALDKLKSKKITVQMTVNETYHYGPGAQNGPVARASGGPFGANQLMLVGEQGPELVRFNSGGTVIPNNRLGSVMPNSGGGGGGGSTLIGFDTNGDALVAAILAALRPVIRTQYAGDVSAALGGAR